MASKIPSEKHYNSTRKEKEEVLVIVPEMNFGNVPHNNCAW